MPIVLSNPGVQRLNAGISNLMALTSPPAAEVTTLYDRWVRFLHSSLHVSLPDVSLFPIFKTFAALYVAIARGHGVPAENIDISLVSLAGSDADRAVRQLGQQLDAMLNASRKSFWLPALAIGAATMLAWRGMRTLRAPARVVVVGARRGRR